MKKLKSKKNLYRNANNKLKRKIIAIALAITMITEKSMNLTAELYTPINQKEKTQNIGTHNNLIDCSKVMEKKSTSLIIIANKLARQIHKKSLNKTINFLLNRDVEIITFLKFI